MRKLFIICGLVFAILLMVQSETSAQVINACANHGNGTLRLVNSPEDCKPMETAISWNTGGTQGPPGPAGTACWDLDANGLCDPGEDKNGGGCDVSDCQGAPGTPGSQGQAGIACWDLNANGTCDTATEDRDGSGVCDVLDCQGVTGVGSLGVYDKNDLFLGILVSFDGSAINVFNPDIPVYLTVNNLIPPYIGPFNLTSLAYTEPDCGGQAATGIGQNLSQLFFEQYSNKYYIVDFTADAIFNLQSRRNSSTGVCQNMSFTGPHAAVKEVTNILFTPGTIAFPITVRPVQ